MKGFKRITLDPGEIQTVEFEIVPEMLATLDEEMKLRVEPGLFEVMIGPNSREYQTILLEVRE